MRESEREGDGRERTPEFSDNCFKYKRRKKIKKIII